jgi:hypothetical protein
MYTMGTLLRHGSQDQKSAYLPKVAMGELRLQAFAVTEPEAGTDTTSTRTTATREGGHYVVNGRKIYTSGNSRPKRSLKSSKRPGSPTPGSGRCESSWITRSYWRVIVGGR